MSVETEWYPRTADDLENLPEAPQGATCTWPMYQDLVFRVDAADGSQVTLASYDWNTSEWRKITIRKQEAA